MGKDLNMSFVSCLICAETELCKVHLLPKYSRPYTSEFKDSIKTFCEFLALPPEACDNGFAISPLCHVCQDRIKLVSSSYRQVKELNSKLDTLKKSVISDLNRGYYHFQVEGVAEEKNTTSATISFDRSNESESSNDRVNPVTECNLDFYHESGCLYSSPEQFRRQLQQKLKIPTPTTTEINSQSIAETTSDDTHGSPLPPTEPVDANIIENYQASGTVNFTASSPSLDHTEITFEDDEIADYGETVTVVDSDADINELIEVEVEGNADILPHSPVVATIENNRDKFPPPKFPQQPKADGVKNSRQLLNTDADVDARRDTTKSMEEKEKSTDCESSQPLVKQEPEPEPELTANTTLTILYCPFKGKDGSRRTCVRRFREQRRLDAHIQTMHMNANIHHSYKCAHCPLGMTSLKKLLDHEKLHTGTKDSYCKECGKAFRTENYLLFHRRKVHGEPYPFVCGQCSKGFNYKCHLRTHELSHTGEFKFRCEKCNSGFHHQSTFTHHKLIHTQERNFSCEKCFKTFRSRGSMYFHIKTHGDRSWMCDACGKAFWTEFRLSMHKDTHNTDKPFECDKCDFKSKTRENLKFHVNYTHNHKRPKKSKVVVEENDNDADADFNDNEPDQGAVGKRRCKRKSKKS